MPTRPEGTDWIVSLSGSFVRLSTDPKPQGKEGDTLYLWDTKEAYIHDGTDWRLL